MKIRTSHIVFSLALFFALLVPSGRAQALTVYADNAGQTYRAGDTVLVSIYADTDGEEVNTIEGKLVLDGNVRVSAITTGGSVFSLWPEKPSYINNTITFTGGSVSSVRGSKLKLFTISLIPGSTGEFVVRSQEVTGYLSDGEGTPLSGSNHIEKLAVEAAGTEKTNALADLVLSDKSAPKEFSIDIGRDPNLYDGKYFVTFYAEDIGSGVQRYEVTEDGFPMVRSGSTYILQDQTLAHKIEVKAIDNAGNIRVETLDLAASFPWKRAFLILLAAAVVGFGLIVLRKTIFKKKK